MSKEIKCIIQKLQNKIEVLTAQVGALNSAAFNTNEQIQTLKTSANQQILSLKNSLYNVGFTTQSSTSFVNIRGKMEIGPNSILIEDDKISYSKSDITNPTQEHIGTIHMRKEIGTVPVLLEGITGGSYTIYVSSLRDPLKSACTISVLNTGLKRTLVNNYVEDAEQSQYISGVWLGSNVALVRTNGSHEYNIIIHGIMTHVTSVPSSDNVLVDFEPNEDGSWYVLGRISNETNAAPTSLNSAYIQNGWSGGAQQYWTNDSTGDEQIVNANTATFGTAPYSGTQCWYAHNLYGYTLGGSFSPKLAFQSEFPMTALGETEFNNFLRGKTIETIFYFKTYDSTSDESLFEVANGAFMGNDRTGFNIDIINDGANDAGSRVYTKSYENGSSVLTDLAVDLPYQTWHKVKATVTYAADGDPNNDVFLYSINDGPDQNVMSWFNIWRLAQGYTPTYGTWILFHHPIDDDDEDEDEAQNPTPGFYIDNISIRLVE